MLRLGALTTVYVNNKNNTAHISKKKKEKKKEEKREEKKNSLRQRQRTARGKRARFGSGVKLTRISGAYRKSNSEVNKVTRRISFCLQERRLPKQQLTQPSSHSTPSCIAVSELKWWQRRVAVRSLPPPQVYLQNTFQSAAEQTQPHGLGTRKHSPPTCSSTSTLTESTALWLRSFSFS